MQVTRSPVFSHFAESLAGMDTIRAYGYEDRFAMMSNDRVDYNHRCCHGSLLRPAEMFETVIPHGASGGPEQSHINVWIRAELGD